MPPLENPRHEAFCQFIIKGLSKADAYEEAGFAPGHDHGARLYGHEDVQQRIAELRVEQADISGATPRSVIAGLLRLAKASEALEDAGGVREARQCLMEAYNLSKAFSLERHMARRGF